jgi:hypothetical protein
MSKIQARQYYEINNPHIGKKPIERGFEPNCRTGDIFTVYGTFCLAEEPLASSDPSRQIISCPLSKCLSILNDTSFFSCLNIPMIGQFLKF